MIDNINLHIYKESKKHRTEDVLKYYQNQIDCLTNLKNQTSRVYIYQTSKNYRIEYNQIGQFDTFFLYLRLWNQSQNKKDANTDNKYSLYT